MALPIRDRRHIAIVVVGVSFGIHQRIFARGRTIHVVVGVHRRLTFGIGDGEQVAVGIIRERCCANNGIGELCDPIQGIRGIEGLLAERVGDVAQPPRRIQNALGLAIERIFHFDGVAEFIGERGDIAQRIGDRKGLVMSIAWNFFTPSNAKDPQTHP